MMNKFNLSTISALVIDIDGTLLRGSQALPGLAELFTWMREKNIAHIVASNNATKTPQHYQKKLGEAGLKLPVTSILTAALAAADYIKKHIRSDGNVYLIGEVGLRSALQSAGLTLVDDSSQSADFVVVGGDHFLTYEKLKHATLHIQRGAQFIGTNPDVLYPAEEGLIPECGVTLAALTAATGVSPIVIGKPSPYLFQAAIQAMGSQPEQTAMIGDRLETDIYGAQQAGLRSILVATGVDNEETIPQKGIYPDLVVENLIALVNLWRNQAGA
jgi:4-nitrophenyl phosphatase